MYEIDEKCQKCKNNGTAICNRCDMYYDEFDPIDRTPQTNADRIRSMTNEELADYMHRIIANVAGNPEICPSISFLEHWLEQEAEEARHDRQ